MTLIGKREKGLKLLSYLSPFVQKGVISAADVSRILTCYLKDDTSLLADLVGCIGMQSDLKPLAHKIEMEFCRNGGAR